MVTSLSGLTLLDLAEYLPTTDMNLVDALNLDGGGSSMLRCGRAKLRKRSNHLTRSRQSWRYIRVKPL